MSTSGRGLRAVQRVGGARGWNVTACVGLGKVAFPDQLSARCHVLAAWCRIGCCSRWQWCVADIHVTLCALVYVVETAAVGSCLSLWDMEQRPQPRLCSNPLHYISSAWKNV